MSSYSVTIMLFFSIISLYKSFGIGIPKLLGSTCCRSIIYERSTSMLPISIDTTRISRREFTMSTSDMPPSYRRPDDIDVPMDKVSVQYARSSGPGGQNVNKLNTKAEMRFHVDSASWIPHEVRQRLKIYQANKINKEGEVIVSSQEHRTQASNKKECIDKLKEMIAEAYMEPKEREMWVGASEKSKAIRRDDKRKRGEVKENRRKNMKDYD